MSEKARWRDEAEFFDREAVAVQETVSPVGQRTVDRYRDRERSLFALEYSFQLAGRLDGKRVLDIGCGNGSNSVLLAKLGARVTGLDVSPGSIAIAKQRAALNAVAARTTFVCAPAEQAEFAPGSFDLVWCEAFLQHVLDDLPLVLDLMQRWCAPNGIVMIKEPVNLSPVLRALRLALFPAPHATVHERPLEPSELDLIFQTFDAVQTRYFGFLGRFDRFILQNLNYEYSSAARRGLSRGLHLTDRTILSLAPFRRLASTVVITARPRV